MKVLHDIRSQERSALLFCKGIDGIISTRWQCDHCGRSVLQERWWERWAGRQGMSLWKGNQTLPSASTLCLIRWVLRQLIICQSNGLFDFSKKNQYCLFCTEFSSYFDGSPTRTRQWKGWSRKIMAFEESYFGQFYATE